MENSLDIDIPSRVRVILLIADDNESENDPDDTPIEDKSSDHS